jgi:Rps23 Pro-64 3,4-dihydroxylase Tpa1-like proline 4-hydroxylase
MGERECVCCACVCVCVCVASLVCLLFRVASLMRSSICLCVDFTPAQIRNAIRDYSEMKRTFFKLAAAAHNKGDYIKAHHYTQKGRENEELVYLALKKLADTHATG